MFYVRREHLEWSKIDRGLVIINYYWGDLGLVSFCSCGVEKMINHFFYFFFLIQDDRSFLLFVYKLWVYHLIMPHHFKIRVFSGKIIKYEMAKWSDVVLFNCNTCIRQSFVISICGFNKSAMRAYLFFRHKLFFLFYLLFSHEIFYVLKGSNIEVSF